MGVKRLDRCNLRSSTEIKVFKRSWLTRKIYTFLNLFDLYWLPNLQQSEEILCKNLELRGVNVVLDIGASIGNFSCELRKNGYKNKLFSYEPILESFQVLEKRSRKDKNWKVYNSAVLDIDSIVEFNISDNLVSSSFLQIRNEHLSAEPKSQVVEKRKVSVLDIKRIISEIEKDSSVVFLKLDTQGSEYQIIKGINDWRFIIGLKLEASLTPLYDGATSYSELIDFMSSKNFELFDIEPGFRDTKSGKLLQVDLIFFKQT